MICKIKYLFYFTLMVGVFAQDYDDIEDRRLHKRKRRPQNGGYGGGGPCGRDADGRFLGLHYVNVNYHVNCGGGGGLHNYPQQDFLGGGGGGGHFPQRPQKPHKPLLGGGGGGHGSHGNGGGLLGSHGGGIFGSHGNGHGNGGGLFGSHGNGGGLGGIFQGNRPQTIVQDAVSGLSDAISRPPFNQGSGNGGGGGGGILGLGLFDGSIINSFTSLFSNSNRPTQHDNTVQYVQDTTTSTNTYTDNGNTNTNTVNNDNVNTAVDERPVHEDHDEIPEVYTNKLRRGDYVAGSPGYGGYYNQGGGYGGFGGGYGGFNYNKAIKKVNRQINSALKPIYQLFRK